jgi:O-antigen biosynthesis protein WbqV
MEVISASALRITAGHLAELQRLAEEGAMTEVRSALFELVAQIRGEKPGAAPALRVVANR